MRFAQEVPKPQTEESASEDTDHKPTELEQMMEKSWDSSDDAEMDNQASEMANKMAQREKKGQQKGTASLIKNGAFV